MKLDIQTKTNGIQPKLNAVCLFLVRYTTAKNFTRNSAAMT